MTKYNKFITVALITAVLTGATALTASAQSMMSGRRVGANAKMTPGVFGTVSSVNGTMITVDSRGFGTNKATTTYSVDAGSAVIMKNNATSTLSSVAVGDRIFAQGKVSGTSVAATTIRDGVMRGNGQNPMNRPASGTTSSTGMMNEQRGNLFGSIGNFFKHLFGF